MARKILDSTLFDALVSRGLSAEAASAISGFTPAPEKDAPAPAPKVNTFVRDVIHARIGCAYSAPTCKGITFAPNGVGSKQHTTCPKGRKALKAARS